MSLWLMLGFVMAPGARSHDFLNLYTGAALALDGKGGELHDPQVQLDRERVYVPDLPALIPFVRPAFYALALAPMAWLPLPAAFVAWLVGQTLLLAACWLWGWWRFGSNALVFAAFFLPLPLGIASGQDCTIMLALFIAAYELHRRKLAFAAGMALALMLTKFHLILLWPVALVIQRRWRMLAGFLTAALLELGVSVAFGGLRGIHSYVELLRNKSIERLSPSPELMVSYQGLADNLGLTAAWAMAAMVVTIFAIFVVSIRNAPGWRMFTLTALASLLVAPHAYAYDAALLLLPVFLTIFCSPHPLSRIAATLFATPIPFALALAGKPYAIASSLSTLLLFLIVSSETLLPAYRPAPPTTPPPGEGAS